MKSFLAVSLFLCLAVSLPVWPDELLPNHREWLEDVSPIITKTEKEIFSKLKTNAEREKFIRLFWRQRDPYPDTAENEFEKQYMERVRFADQNFGHETSKRGSQTERGTYYLILGPPLERNFFTTQSQIWPMELWFYKGEIEYGLPPYFYLIFYQPQGIGEYRLYSPGVEGPEKLVIPTLAAQSLNRSTAFQIIKKISPELAGASLSYLPGDQVLQGSAFSSASVIASVRSFPEKKFSDAYARTYLSYKDYVETEYSHDFVESSFVARTFRQGGRFFVHWALEPKKINFADRGSSYQAAFDLVLRLEDNEGNLVLEKEEEIPLSVTPEQYKTHASQLFAFQDILPSIPGRFKLFGLLKNKTAQDFTSFSSVITVPEGAEDLRFGDLILYHSREKMSESQSRMLTAFSFGGNHYLVNTRNDFPVQGEMGAYIQVYNLKNKNLDPKTFILLEIRSADAEGVALSQRKVLSEALSADGEGLDTGPFSLSSLKPGYYSVELSLGNENNQKLLTAKENIVLLSQPYPVVPWVYAKSHQPFPNSEHLFILSSEYFLTKQYQKAYGLADQALKLKDKPQTRILLAKILYALGRYQDSLAAVIPAYETAKSREAAKVVAADYAGLKDWASALVYLERLMAEATETSVLNLAAECYLNLNQPERALPLLEKSLEIDPNQPSIKALEEKAKKQFQFLRRLG
jgi:GWxTD domain-containing protein